MKVDVFYPVVASSGNNIGLKYSLRSLKNINQEINNVFIVGHLPDWAQNVIHIPYNDIPRVVNGTFMGWKNIRAKWALFVEKTNQEHAVFMNDDIYILRPTTIGYYIREEKIKDLITLQTKRKRPPYVIRFLKNIEKMYPDSVSEFIHVPQLRNIENFRKMLAKYPNPIEVGTLGSYSNEFKTEHNYEFETDCKIYNFPSLIPDAIKNRNFFSSGDDSEGHPNFTVIMNKLFPEISIYEKC